MKTLKLYEELQVMIRGNALEWCYITKQYKEVPANRNTGICNLLTDANYRRFMQAKRCAYNAWPEFNGDYVYPVDGVSGYRSNRYSKWGKSKDALKRRRLLRHLVAYFKERDL